MSFNLTLRDPGSGFDIVFGSGSPPATAGYFKVRDVSDWVLKPVKVWMGSEWSIKPVKRWTGADWEIIHSDEVGPSYGTVSFRAYASNIVSSGTSITTGKPTGTVENDLMIAFLTTYTDAATNHTPPAGWTSITKVSAQGANIEVFYKIAGPSEGSDYTFTTDVTEYIVLDIATYYDINLADPICANTSSSSGDDTSREGLEISTEYPNTKLLFYSASYLAEPNDVPSGMTQRLLTDACLILFDETIASVGATGGRAVNQDDGGSFNNRWQSIMIGINPATI